MSSNGKVPFVDLLAQYATIGEEIEENVVRVLRSGQYVAGPDVDALEAEFAEYCGVGHAVSVNSGTAALHVALLALGIGPGDEVITASHTFVATGEAIALTGATPVFVDIDPETYTIDPELIEDAITPRTKAIIPVHLYGQPADMDPILDIARSHGLRVIEDACQAHGADYKGRRAGSMSDIACFSFYPSKNMGSAGEAGMVVTDSAELAEKMSMIREHGQSQRYHHDLLGLNYRMSVIQSAVLRVKLRHLDGWNEARRSHAAAYNRLLADADLTLPYERPDVRHVYHLYVVRCADRAALSERLSERGIATGIHYPVPIHLQPPYRHFGDGPESLPHTEAAVGSILSLPMYAELTEGQLERVAEAVREVVGERAAAR